MIRNSVWAGIIMEQIVSYLLMVAEFINLKQKDSEIAATPLCLGNVSKGWSVDNII